MNTCKNAPLMYYDKVEEAQYKKDKGIICEQQDTKK